MKEARELAKSRLEELMEHALNESLAYLFGERTHVLLARAGQDQDGTVYIDCVWQRIGSLIPSETRIYEGSVADTIIHLPRDVRREVHQLAMNDRMLEGFRREIFSRGIV